MQVLIVGGAGYIGSYVNKLLTQAGHSTVVFDNLCRGQKEAVAYGEFIEGDIGSLPDLQKLFTAYRFDAVFHFAALKNVGESVTHPALYYQNNVANTLQLLEVMKNHHVNFFIFSSSAAIFGLPVHPKINENHPCAPINPYGESKWMVEKILRDFDLAYGLKSCSLRYFNAAGADPEGKVRFFESTPGNLIPIVLNSLLPNGKEVTLFGDDYPTKDGTCTRDYIHIHDLAVAHLLALEKLLETKTSTAYNLGNGQGFTVKDVIEAAERVTGKKVPVKLGPRRAGDPPVLLADATKAKEELGWQPIYKDLDTIISHAWESVS